MHADYIERLLEFAQADIRAIPEPEKVRYFKEMAKILAGAHEHGQTPDDMSETAWKRLSKFQKEWQQSLGWIFENLNGFYKVSFKVVWNGTFQWSPKERQGRFKLETAYDGGEIEASITKTLENGSKTTNKMAFPQGAYYLFSALNGFPSTALGRCAHCGKLFFNPTKRRQIYCNPTCRNAAGVSRYRGKS
ncbi:MAG: hypothetical protein JRD04_00965 [Deltaproteobacteria bacterium]|nr:hypothetical protein [Deltaproteobacteria bacterium]